MELMLLQLLAYDDWANREVATTLERTGGPEKARELLAHIIGAEWLWYARIRATAARMAVWPKLTLAECGAESRQLLAAWSELLAAAGEAGLDLTVSYKNTKGEPWSSTVREVLTHVAMHGAYHRGQIALLVRESGHEPASTDYIHAVRNRLL